MASPERYAVAQDKESLWKKSTVFKVGAAFAVVSIAAPVLLVPGLIMIGGSAAWHHEKNPLKGKGK